jgi:GTPase SAR1 family protein
MSDRRMTEPVLQKKICMLGGFSVGKTSLVKRFVASVFSEAYLTTVGVKIDKKTVHLGERAVNLNPNGSSPGSAGEAAKV